MKYVHVPFSDTDVKTKWQNLRSNFMREKRKLKHIPSGSAADNSSKLTWPYFDSMQFLDSSLKHRGTSRNVASDTFTDSSTVDEPTDQDVDVPLTQTPNETENGTTSQVLCENKPTNPMPSKKRYKKIIYGVDEIDKNILSI
jgi:hypothetical protein